MDKFGRPTVFDPWWNPATESQAVDRTHRIGQDKNVMVYRLVATGTIEEKVMALKEQKAQLPRPAAHPTAPMRRE